MYKTKLKGNNNSVPEKYSPIANEDKFFIKAKNPPIPLLGRNIAAFYFTVEIDEML